MQTVDCVLKRKINILNLLFQSFLLSLNSLIDLVVQSHPFNPIPSFYPYPVLNPILSYSSSPPHLESQWWLLVDSCHPQRSRAFPKLNQRTNTFLPSSCHSKCIPSNPRETILISLVSSGVTITAVLWSAGLGKRCFIYCLWVQF